MIHIHADIECVDGCKCGGTPKPGKLETLELMVMQSGEDGWEDEYLTRLTPMFEQITGKALDEVAEWIRSRDTVPSEIEFTTELERILGEEFAKINTEVANRFVDEAYNWNYAADTLPPGIDVSFGGADVRAVNALAESDNLVLSKFLKNSGTSLPLRKFIQEEYLENGEALFGRDNGDAIRDLKSRLGGRLGKITDKELRRIVETSVQRIRNRGTLQQIETSAAVFVQIFEPTRECPFCQAMHLQIIKVKDAVSRAVFLDTLSEDQFIQQFKVDKNKPELENLDRFIGEGFLPPFHPHCRGRLRIPV